MAEVKIITDSVACIPDDIKETYGMTTVPAANIFINGKAFIDGQDITADEAYAQIEKDPDSFVTSATTPELLMSTYQKLGEETDAIVFVTIASALTALNKTATLAAQQYMEKKPGKKIIVVDSRACAGTQGLVAIGAAKAARAGKSVEDVAAYAEAVREQCGGLMLLDTLRYVYRTGRMSKTASKIISMFNIRPINYVTDEGTIEMLDRTRKKSEGLEKLLRHVDERKNGSPLHFMVCHAAAAETARQISEELKKRFDCLDIIESDYSPVMGYGSGPGALFIGFHPEVALS